MQLTKSVICLSALVMKICFSALIIETSKLDELLVGASIDVLETCYSDRFGTVGLAGPSVRSIIERISLTRTVISATLIDGTSRAVSHATADRASRYKLQVFVVGITDPRTLVDSIVQIKNSKWWNHMASFLLIDRSPIENECSNAYKVLWEAWKMDLLNSKFMCTHPTRGILIYTFNPFTTKAPVPWQQEKTYNGMNGHVWTLFVQEYRKHRPRCDTLDFDKTSDLGGYEIRAVVQGMENWWFTDPAKKPSISNRINNITAQMLMSSLNATWKMRLRPDNGRPAQDNKGNPSPVAVDVISGNRDIGLNLLIQNVWAKYETTDPLIESPVAVVTQYPGHKSQLDKLVSVLDRSSRYCVILVFLITLLFFKFYMRKPLIRAILSLVLLMGNAGLPKIPRKLAPRIYLGSLFVFVVTIQGIYSGVFAGLLTRPVRLSSVNSVEDLARSHHTIYGRRVWHSFLNQTTFEGRFVKVVELSCTNWVRRDPKAACINTRSRLISDAAKFELHLSHESIGHFNYLYLIRPDWPLGDRVNLIYGRVAASGIVDLLFKRELNSEIIVIESYKNRDRDQPFKMLTLRELSFAFVILGVGLGCATIIFVIEVAIFDTKILKPRSCARKQITVVE